MVASFPQTTVSPMASPSQLGLATEEGMAHQEGVVVPPCTVAAVLPLQPSQREEGLDRKMLRHSS